MNGRRGARGFFLILLLFVIILLQVGLLVRSARFDRGVNHLVKVLERGSGQAGGEDEQLGGGTAGGPAGEDEGDWLVWGFRVEPKTLNQFSAENDIYSRWITVPYIFEPLLVYDYNNLTMKPWLAESYEISDDGLEITFRLRHDIYFSDGVPVTADDVVFTYKTAVDANVDAANVANLFVDVDRAEQIDKRVVKFHLKRPYFKALENLSFWDFGILPKHVYKYDDAKEFNNRVSNPVGSGPFVFERWDTGRQVVLRRNENYWGAKPKLRKIVYRFITNAVAAVQALRSHDVDIIIPQPEQFADLANDEDFKKEFRCLSYWNPGVPFYYIGWNEDTVFFSDKRVRQAMTCIINREEIVARLLKGHGRMITGPFYIQGTQSDPNVEPWPYDPDRAERLLASAGWIDRDGDGLLDKDGKAGLCIRAITFCTGDWQS